VHQEFDASANAYVDRDKAGVARQLLHLQAPFRSSAPTLQLAAAEYLRNFAELLDIEPGQLDNLGLAPDTHPTNAAVEYRFLGEKQQLDSATVAYQQTALGLPVWEAGLAVQLKRGDPLRVLSSQSTQHPDIEVKSPARKAVATAESIDERELALQLGIEPRARQGKDTGSKQAKGAASETALRIERRELIVYRYEHAKVLRDGWPDTAERPAVRAREQAGEPQAQPTLPLPPVPDTIEEGRHYVALKVDFELELPPFGRLHWVAILEVKTLAVLYLRPFVDGVTGLVFDVEPSTTNGGPPPSAPSASLNPVRVSRTLAGLDPPAAGTQSLSGDTIRLADLEAPIVAPPTEPSGAAFDFDARTDDFAAVNAYHHCDRFFRIVDGMGWSLADYFPGTTFPTPVDHRGSIGTADGIEINAHCVGTSGGAGIQRTTFALADLGDTAHPIGIACDFRVVLHELAGHGVLYNHVQSANYRFSHSSGDSVAAILNDPGTQAPDRFVTFPWVNIIGRRHDRRPSDGWGWSGNIALHPFSQTYDSKGYNNEQILSTTMFRIYCSIGGDSSDLPTQQFAARMTVYLILRAIATLTPPTNPSNAAAFATALMTADQGDWTSENITGGAYGKVIRWAFEQQGLYQPAGTATPNDEIGAPPSVDVYIDDGRAGEYQYQANFWSNQSVWNRRNPDAGATHEDPIVGQTNYAYVKIKNRGSQPATAVSVQAFHANPAAGLSYPIDWLPMTTAELAAPDVAPNDSAEIVVGPFEWTPTHVGHECMLMVVSADGDASNTAQIAAADSIPEWRLVPNDNNVAQRNVAPVPGTGTSGLVAEFHRLEFELKNPFATRARMEIRHTLPALLSSRGWRLEFLNRGGAAFWLGAGESRSVVMALVAGKDFAAADVENSQERTIHVLGLAGGILVGGMSYELDPKLDRPERDHRVHGDRHATHVQGLVECLELEPERVRRVVVRKITLDIEFEEPC
jgi:zinc metalloprotease ZmpB